MPDTSGQPASPLNRQPAAHVPHADRNLGFQKHQRLRKTAEFKRCYDFGQRAGDDHLLLFAVRNNLPFSRVGLSVSKKHGNAVRRNLRKRRLREAFRLRQHELPTGLDIVLVPRQRPDSSLQNFQTSLLRLVKKVARRLDATADANDSGRTMP